MTGAFKTPSGDVHLRRRPCEMDLSRRRSVSREDYTRDMLQSCPRICIGGMRGSRPVVTAEEVGVVRTSTDGVEWPLIRLSLRKPRNWNWKLTTTTSSPSVIAPLIRLVDVNGNVLLEESATRGEKQVSKGSKKNQVPGERGEKKVPGEKGKNQVPEEKGKNQMPEGNKNINQCITSRQENAKSINSTSSEPSNRNKLECEGNGSPPPAGTAGRSTDEFATPEMVKRHVTSHSRHRHRVSDVTRPRDVTSTHLLRGTRSDVTSQQDSSCHSSRRNSQGNKTDDGESHRKKQGRHRKLDSGYKSFAMTTDEAKVGHETRKGKFDRHKGRRVTPVTSSSSSEDEVEAAERAKRRKRRHRKAAVVGDRLLSVNHHDALFYDQTVDLLRDAPDVVHLKLSPRRRAPDNNNISHRDASTSGTLLSSRRSKRRSKRRDCSPPTISVMGSNVSRHSEKGLSGRRTQSSGNLCNGNKQLARDVGRILSSCSHVGAKDRNKFCGSLPNHLDGDYNSVGDNEGEDECFNNNNGTSCGVVRMNGDVAAASSASVASTGVVQKNGVELRLMPQHDLTALHDQGYGSERSPEDEHLPPLPIPDPFWNLSQRYPFITPDASFEVSLLKGNRGLGLSVTGGVDTPEQWPGLIRIKRLFPHQPAWQSGLLDVGDVLLAANGVALTGLSNYQALEVLRTTPNNVILAVCRPPSDVFSMSAPTEPPPLPRRDPANSITSSSRILVPLPLLVTEEPSGEFDIILTKVNRSLGFTLRKEDESVLGHYVRALVREPALSDGRIRPGDKIVSVNDMPMSPLSHEEAVAFLRQCGDNVKLRLYRDAAQTPVAALSPTDEGFSKPKPMLRQEAQDMLSDLAVRKLSPGNSSGSSQGFLRLSEGGGPSPGASPRRRRLTKTPSPDILAVTQDKLGQRYLLPSPSGDSDYSREPSRNNTFLLTPADGAENLVETSEDVDGDKPERPKFLDLCNEGVSESPGGGPRKQKYMFSASGSRCEDTLALTTGTDDLTKIGGSSQSFTNNDEDVGSSMEPASLPPLSTTSSSSTFSYRNPAYQSAHPACNVPKKLDGEEEGGGRVPDEEVGSKANEDEGEGTRGLLKWKGVMFGGVDNDSEAGNASMCLESESGNEEELIVELNRGWNSRLGFSLQGNGHHTYISAVYSDSVAAKDGRLQANDRLVTVNDENVEDMSTAEIIDLLRKIRGTIGIRVLRKSGPNPQVT